jgi:hypothetical protein
VFAVGQVAQSSLRSIIGKSDLDDLLSDRERLHEGLALMIDSPAAGWGVHIDRVEIKDVQLPESLKRSMSRQAEAERERRARVITADGEFQAAQQLANASRIMADTPEAMQLRLRRGGRREELHPRDALPRGTPALLRPGRPALRHGRPPGRDHVHRPARCRGDTGPARVTAADGALSGCPGAGLVAPAATPDPSIWPTSLLPPVRGQEENSRRAAPEPRPGSGRPP